MVGETDILDKEVSGNRSTGGSVQIGNTRYAVGLMWAPLQNPDDPLPEIREAMESEPGADLYCQRTSATPQYGLGKTSLGHRSGEPSLAASVAAALSDKTSACGVFKVDEGWWFFAIRNDLILAEEDVLFASESEAKRAFFAMMAVPDWDVRIVPAEWQVEGTTQMSLADMVANTRKTRLFELSATKKTQILVVVAIILIALVVGLAYIIYTLLQGVFTPEKIVVLPTPEVVKPVEPAPEKPKPWEKVPDMTVFFNKCWNNAYQLDAIVIPGWTMNKVVCTPKGLTTGWRLSWQHGGRVAWLKFAMDEYKLNRVSIKPDQSGTSATGSVRFTDIPLVASVPSLTADQLRDELTDIKQATGLPIQFSEQTIVDPPNNADGSIPANQQQYKYFAFVISSPYSPWEWKVFFDKFSGVEFLKIEFDPNITSNNKWTYEGRIYAK